MTRKTRIFVLASLLVLCAGVGTGLVAYFGLATSVFTAAAGGPDELRYLPGHATLVAFADVHQVMTSELRGRLRTAMPFTGDGQKTFQADTGINLETDIDRVVFGLTPVPGGPGGNAGSDGGAAASGRDGATSGLLLARGRFDAVRVEAFLRERGAAVESYKGHPYFTQPHREGAALAFLEPGLVAVGGTSLVRRAIDLKGGGDSVVTNEALMSRVRDLERGNVWAVGRFDALTATANMTQGMMGQLPAITWFSASGQVDAGVRAALKAETRDEEAGTALRDLVRGIFALAKFQVGARPDLQSLLQTVQLGGTAETVTLSLDLSPQMLDALADSVNQLPRPARPSR